MLYMNPRFEPCRILQDNSIPCVVWFEDAVGYHRVPTVVFKLHLLVPDMDDAAQILIQNDWAVSDTSGKKSWNPLEGEVLRCLDPPSYLVPPLPDVRKGCPPPPPSEYKPHPSSTVLLRVTDWKYDLPEINKSSAICEWESSLHPNLPQLLDALIDRQLDAGDEQSSLQMHVSVMIAYLYGYVPLLRERGFAEQLKYEHRQYHFDKSSGMFAGTRPFINHQREIREALRQKTYQLQECSASRDNEDLFPERVLARIRASQLANQPRREESDESEEDRLDTEENLNEGIDESIS